jgi:hypothetical protein
MMNPEADMTLRAIGHTNPYTKPLSGLLTSCREFGS